MRFACDGITRLLSGAMRLRIQSVPPLLPQKVWFTPGECITVANLKSALANALDLNRKSAAPLVLTLDGFDLLEPSLVVDVLRDGDLVVVTLVETTKKTTDTGKKRKRSTSPVHRTQVKLPSLPLSTSSDEEDESESESESDDSSSSDSSSSSASTTPPTSASMTSVPQTQTARRTPVRAPTVAPISAATKVTVPPGKGKPSTHSRNMRRRIKRVASASAPVPLPTFVSTTNATPIAQPDADTDRRAKARQGRIHGPAPDVAAALNKAFGGNERGGRLDPGTLSASPASASSSSLLTPQYQPTEAEEMLNVQMMSMLPKSKNKNKSRRMAEDVDPRSRKIVFGTPPPPEQQISFGMGDDEGEARRVQRPALIPPSSLPAHLIPANVFITYIDVEEGLKKSKKKKRRVEEEASWGMDEAVLEDNTVLDYGEELEADETGCALELDPSMFDFDAAPLITSHVQLTQGCMVGFIGLTINYGAPESGRRYGRVLSWTEQAVTIEPMFGGDEMQGDENFEWGQVQGSWKLLQ
ncbi:hypothetical protein DFH09DRAFT_1137992 [Mycena vulgaris]|nr:hypothetical protein DFH09DRAFT_1137992 [Mycena vulgaris]